MSQAINKRKPPRNIPSPQSNMGRPAPSAPMDCQPVLNSEGTSHSRRSTAVKDMKKLILEERSTNLILRRWVAYFLLIIFALNTVSTLVAIYLVGFGLMILSNTVILTLIGETIAYAAAMFIIVTKFLFPAK